MTALLKRGRYRISETMLLGVARPVYGLLVRIWKNEERDAKTDN